MDDGSVDFCREQKWALGISLRSPQRRKTSETFSLQLNHPPPSPSPIQKAIPSALLYNTHYHQLAL